MSAATVKTVALTGTTNLLVRPEPSPVSKLPLSFRRIPDEIQTVEQLIARYKVPGTE